MNVEMVKSPCDREEGGLGYQAKDGRFKGRCRGMMESGGRNGSMNSVELALCAVGGSRAMFTLSFAERYGIEINDFWIEIEDDMNAKSIKDDFGIKSRYSDIKFKIHIKSGSNEKTIKDFAKYLQPEEAFQKACSDSLNLTATGLVIEN